MRSIGEALSLRIPPKEPTGRLRVTLSEKASGLVLAEIEKRHADAERWTNLLATISEEHPDLVSPWLEDATEEKQQATIGIAALVNASIELSYGSYDEQGRVDLLCEVAG
jgi:hypothetical protein